MKLYLGLTRKSRNKYGARKIRIKTGDVEEVYDSAGEMKRYGDLLLQEKIGNISNLKRQVRIPLIVNGIHLTLEDVRGRRRRLFYEADFTYNEQQDFVIEDFKGYDTPLSRLKRAIVEAITGNKVRVTRKPTKVVARCR
nr:DUF1064 domain-containing protein [Microvirga tunisiensis]